jgi:hypothetical protein
MQGLLATTYDLNPDFLELDFLPAVFGLSARSPWANRITLEKRLSELTQRAVIFTEARRYRGRPRSLQLELIPAISPRGSTLHAKVTLLVFERAVRLIVGSANLTEPGYRRNREAVAVITASDESPQQAALIREALTQAERVLSNWLTEDARKVIRCGHETLAQWTDGPANGATVFCWTGGQSKLWSIFLGHWPRDEKVRRVSIISPFWSENAGTTLRAFLTEMRRLQILGSEAEVSSPWCK